MITKGLVLDLPFAEGGGDRFRETVTGATGKFINLPTFGRDTKYGNYIDTDGTNDYGRIALTNDQINLNQVSIELLLRPDSVSQYKRPFHKTDGMKFEFDNSWGWVFAYGRSTTAGKWSIATPSTGNVIHVVITYDASSTANDPIIYQDGTSRTITERATPVGTPSNTATTLFVASDSGSADFWDGRIYYIRMWNRILTASEVEILYQNPNIIYKQTAQPLKVGKAATSGNVTINAAVLTATASVQAPTVQTSATFQASVLSVVSSIQTSTPTIVKLPSVLTAASQVMSPQTISSATFSAPVLAVSASIQSPVRQVSVSPSVLTGAATFQALQEKVVRQSPSVLTGAASIQAPTKSVLAQLTALTATASVIAPTAGVSGDVTIFAPVLTASAVMVDSTRTITKNVAVIVGSAAVQSVTKLATKDVATLVAQAQLNLPSILAQQNVTINAPVLTAVAVINGPQIRLGGLDISDVLVYDADIDEVSGLLNSIADRVVYSDDI